MSFPKYSGHGKSDRARLISNKIKKQDRDWETH